MTRSTDQPPVSYEGQPITISEIQSKFEIEHNSTNEPWDYSASGAEQIRYKNVLAIGKRLSPRPQQLLEIGCSFGQFTKKLAGWPIVATITDISPTAIATAERALSTQPLHGTEFHFRNVSATEPFAPDSFYDVVTLMDVMESVGDSMHIQVDIINNLKRMMKPDAIIIITDYQNPKMFEQSVAKYKAWGLELLEQHYMHDRIWFSLRSSLKGLAKVNPFKRLLASETVAQSLAKLSKKRGVNGSKHMVLVMRKAR